MSCKISCKDRASHGSSPPCISREFSIHYVEPISHTHFTISGSILRISWNHATSHSGGEISPKSAVRDATQLTASNHSSDLTASNQSSLHQISPVIWCSQLSRKLTYRTLQHTASHCNTLQHTATHCNTLQHTATHLMQSIESQADLWESARPLLDVWWWILFSKVCSVVLSYSQLYEKTMELCNVRGSVEAMELCNVRGSVEAPRTEKIRLQRITTPKFPTSFHGSPRTCQTYFHGNLLNFKQVYREGTESPSLQRSTQKSSRSGDPNISSPISTVSAQNAVAWEFYRYSKLRVVSQRSLWYLHDELRE